MIGTILKVLGFFTTTAVAIPYTTALLCNLAYGWPRIPHRYRRAFNPRKVYSLNLAVIQQLILIIRFLPLYVQFRTYYKYADSSKIMKDKPYGKHNQKLDLYLPNQKECVDRKSYPVVVFVYGGAWGSGSKKMYGMVCSAIANRLGAIVCCPDYSTYPKGYVDTMVEDLVDCVTWLYNNVEQYNGDKSSIMMLGHSSGAHLCFMSVYKFCVNTSRDINTQSETTQPSTSLQEKSFEFQDKYFGETSSNSGDELEHSKASGSFYFVDGTNKQKHATDCQVLSSQISETELFKGSLLESGLEELMQTNDSNIRYRGSENTSPDRSGGFLKQKDRKVKDGCGDLQVNTLEGEEDSEDNDSVITILKPDEHFEDRGVIDMAVIGQSVKAIIGMAGVYDIGEHFQHESKRGVEDLSTMSKAMYGPEQFDQFSPSYLFNNIDQPIRLPKIVLLHGTDDHVVPLSSTTKFGDILQKYHSDLVVRIIPNCDHYEICLDLNKPSRKYHQTVMAFIEKTAQTVFP